MELDEIRQYEGRNVRVTVQYEGELSADGDCLVLTTGEGLRYVHPDHVTRVEGLAPDFWPPVPGDVLESPAGWRYLCGATRDGWVLSRPSESGRGDVRLYSSINQGPALTPEGSSWKLLLPGPSRTEKEQ